MLRRLILLLIAFGVCLPGPLPAMEPGAPTLQGKVTWIYDGDTIEVEPHGKVRLIGIDCPEREASERDNQFVKLGADRALLRSIYKQALKFNIRHAKGQTVTLELDTPERDRHGRILAYVRLPDGRLLNRVLLEEGLTIVYRRFDFRKKDDFLRAEADARRSQVGLWRPSGR